LTAAAVVGLVLLGTSQGYGYERDELYFRMLRPAWGYVDQPPLVPWLVRLSTHLADQPWALRLPATLSVAASVLVVTLITRELGGGRLAQILAAWLYAGSAAVSILGHVLVTATLDLLTWPLICLFVARALLRDEDTWWLWAGLVAGLASYDKLLVSWLLLGIAIGLVLVGPRRVLWSPAVLLGAAITFALAMPNLVYQVTHGWPQLDMAAALADNNAADVRAFMWPLMLIILGPPLVPIWIAGIVSLLRRVEWRPVRCFVPAFGVVVLLTFIGGTQPHYPTGLLVVLLAAGMVPTGELVSRSPAWFRVVVLAAAVNALVSMLIGLPLIPVGYVGSTPVPAISLPVADQVGWPQYVNQVARVWSRISPSRRHHAAIITSNYGEAGAIARFGPERQLPRPFSGQNSLYDEGPPPRRTTTVVFVGGQLPFARHLFQRCSVEGRLDNHVGVDNEEQGMPVAVCSGPRHPWRILWRRLHHLD